MNRTTYTHTHTHTEKPEERGLDESELAVICMNLLS